MTKTVLIPLASLAALGTAALLTIGPPIAPAHECVMTVEPAVAPIDPPTPRRFARPPMPPTPVPPPLPVASR